MDEVPNKERLQELVSLICEEQNKIIGMKGISREMNASIAAKLEPLKTPIYVMQKLLGFGDLPQGRTQAYWLASFKTSPTDFLSECIRLLRSGEVPVSDRDFEHTLINFYSELIEVYE